MIELKNVRKLFHTPNGEDLVAVDDVSLVVKPGETLCLIGTSGCGKTTLLKMINRLIDPTSGEILVAGRNVLDYDVIRLRRQMGYVIQKGGLLPHLTVRENIQLLCNLEGWPIDQGQRRAVELLKLVNLPPEEFQDRYPRELSGGQRQRVGVARSLALDPKYVLMDEPFGALDPITRRQLHREFLELEQLVQKTLIIVTHDMHEAFLLGDRVALMNQGKLLQIGVEGDFRDRPATPFVRDFLHSQFEDGVKS